MAASDKGKIKKQKLSKKLSSKSKFKIYGKHQAGIGSSSKGHAFAEYRKLKVLNEYKRLYKRQHKKKAEEDEGEVRDIGELNYRRPKRSFPKMENKYQVAEVEHKNKKAERERLKKEVEESRRKREQDFEEKQQKRRETHRKLKLKTKRGQPIMSNHIEFLLERIERK